MTGVALAAALRLAFFSLFLFTAAFKAGKIGFPNFWRRGASKVIIALGTYAAGLWLNSVAGFSIWGAIPLTAAFLVAAYYRLLEAAEREFLRSRIMFWRLAGREAAAGPEGSA
jgi:hypothetical protein